MKIALTPPQKPNSLGRVDILLALFRTAELGDLSGPSRCAGRMPVLVVLFFPGGLKALLRRHAAKRLRLEGSRNATVPLDA